MAMTLVAARSRAPPQQKVRAPQQYPGRSERRYQRGGDGDADQRDAGIGHPRPSRPTSMRQEGVLASLQRDFPSIAVWEVFETSPFHGAATNRRHFVPQ